MLYNECFSIFITVCKSQSYAKNIFCVHSIFHIEVQLLSVLLKQLGGFYLSLGCLLPVSVQWVFINFIRRILDWGSFVRGCVSTSINRWVPSLFAWPGLQCQHFWSWLRKSCGKQRDQGGGNKQDKMALRRSLIFFFFLLVLFVYVCMYRTWNLLKLFLASAKLWCEKEATLLVCPESNIRNRHMVRHIGGVEMSHQWKFSWMMRAADLICAILHTEKCGVGRGSISWPFHSVLPSRQRVSQAALISTPIENSHMALLLRDILS